ncbi:MULTISPECIES: hypothetical protein [Shouchella]|uniref:Uncharacterized protein n=1 Tax=Shouchella lehensis G1 TaxID=1246626 RepID=A0A060LYE5_9BACI|nr:MULTISPECIES: hypothetical protein [Bacillaceae]AIC92829.1 hypothetical protein BleG1_0221 [Shouchella lehensis G1]
MENKRVINSNDINVKLEDYSVKSSTVMQEMEASIYASVIIRPELAN